MTVITDCIQAEALVPSILIKKSKRTTPAAIHLLLAAGRPAKTTNCWPKIEAKAAIWAGK